MNQPCNPDYFTTVNTFAVAELIDSADSEPVPESIPEPVSGLAVLAVGAAIAGSALKRKPNA